MDYDTKRVVRGIATGTVIGGVLVGGGVLLGYFLTKHKGHTGEQPVYNINVTGDHNIVGSDLSSKTKINVRAKNITVAPSYNSNSNGTKNTGSNGNGTNGSINKPKPESIDDTVEGNAGNNRPVNNRNPEDADFKGYMNGVAYFETKDGTRFRIPRRQYSSIVVRGNGLWFGAYRISSMPSDMERAMINQLNSRLSTTRGTYFHSGWRYSNRNTDGHW